MTAREEPLVGVVLADGGPNAAYLRHAAEITARIDRLPASWSSWSAMLILSLAGIFEVYDLYQTAYVPPGLIHDGIFSADRRGFFGLSDQATFAASTFLGLFLGAIAFARAADRLGRRA